MFILLKNFKTTNQEIQIDDSLSMFYKNEKLTWRLITYQNKKQLQDLKTREQKIIKISNIRQIKNKSPWHIFNPDWHRTDRPVKRPSNIT